MVARVRSLLYFRAGGYLRAKGSPVKGSWHFRKKMTEGLSWRKLFFYAAFSIRFSLQSLSLGYASTAPFTQGSLWAQKYAFCAPQPRGKSEAICRYNSEA